tara:strand:+ start:434 stop:895 length:462 start_codon:yes stop_codon:yes gene_type:complete
MEWANPPQFPSLLLPEAPGLPVPILEIPRSDVPSYRPLVVPPNTLQPPPGIEGINSDPPPENEETKEQKTDSKSPQITPPIPPEAQIIEIPFTDVEIPMPTTTIMTTAATTAFISVAATLTATSLFKYLVMVMKPIMKTTWNKITKKKEQKTS